MLKILRRTQECGGGLQELKPIDQNLQYDFNYQQFTYLPQEIKVLPVCADVNNVDMHDSCIIVYVHMYMLLRGRKLVRERERLRKEETWRGERD